MLFSTSTDGFASMLAGCAAVDQQRGLEDDGIGDLVRPGGIGHARAKVRGRVIAHPGQHAGERQGDIVLRVRPGELHPADAFDAHDVRIGSLQARRLVGAMKVNQQLVLARPLSPSSRRDR